MNFDECARQCAQATRERERNDIPHYEKPCASYGLKSYRYRGRYGWVMIGAKDTADALREAARSVSDHTPTLDRLEAWDGHGYVPAN